MFLTLTRDGTRLVLGYRDNEGWQFLYNDQGDRHYTYAGNLQAGDYISHNRIKDMVENADWSRKLSKT